MILFAQNDEL